MFDAPVKSRKTISNVIPAKAGIQKFQPVTKHWTPAFAGVTSFYEVVSLGQPAVKLMRACSCSAGDMLSILFSRNGVEQTVT
jgi:hypothetical protein